VTVRLLPSRAKGKKWAAVVREGDSVRTVNFGQKGASDYTKHRDQKRKQLYLARHRKRENWTKSGIRTAGFWSRWLLWNKQSLHASKQDVQRRFGVKFV
jgi:hypothetical protein